MVFEDDNDVVSDIIHKCQVYVWPRRIRIREFFLNFDPLNSGRCTKVQFGRGLDTAGIRFTDAEIEAGAEHFTEMGPKVQKPQVVNYKRFCDAVDEIFASDIALGSTQDGREERLQSMFKMSMTSFAPNMVEDDEHMDHIMHRLATLCKSRGIVFKYLFHDFERGGSPSPSNANPRRGGKCSVEQFRRTFPFKKEFNEKDVETLINRYLTNNGESVHFQAIHNDISEVLSPEPPPFPRSDLVLKDDPTQWDHMSLNVVKKIQAKVVEKRVRLTEYFADFDPLRKGFCTAGQFKTVLTILNLEKELNRDDFRVLLNCYARDDGMFCYALFARDVDNAFSVPGLEKDPMAQTPLPDATTTALGRRNRMVLSDKRKARINHLEDKIRSRIYQRRVLMMPAFRDMDRKNCGTVSRGQFHRVMGTLGFEMTPEDVSLLAGYYCDRGNHNEFNYVDFIKACDPPNEQEEVAMSQLNAPYQDAAPSKYFQTGMKVRPLDRSFSAGSLTTGVF
jgi:Ca2+-binding EF-hand superfamily protein